MAQRIAELFASFPASSWAEEIIRDLHEATAVRIASGFIDQRGARAFLDAVSPEAGGKVLLALAGISGTDVLDVFTRRPGLTVRASKIVEFHWKLALLEGRFGRIAYVGSANFTHKGWTGRGELMLRLTGGALTDALWKTLSAEFEDWFSDGKTIAGEALRNLVARFERTGDDVRGRHADLEREIERAVRASNVSQAQRAQRAWFMLWDSEMTAREAAAADRVMGPALEGWTRGQVWVERPDDAIGPLVRRVSQKGKTGLQQRQRMEKDHMLLAEDATGARSAFLFGRVARVEEVQMDPNNSFWVADVEALVEDVSNLDHPTAYAAIRDLVRRRDPGPMPPDTYERLLSILAEARLLTLQ